MAKVKTPRPSKYEATVAAARKAPGDINQANWLDRLKAVMKQRAKAEKKQSGKP